MRTEDEAERGGGEAGFALPLALLGLVAVSLLVTTALITSATEVALSSAHQEGTRVLYRAEAALQQLVAERVQGTPANERITETSYPVTLPTGQAYTVAAARLGVSPTTTLPNGTIRRMDTYSLVAAPANGRGRSVGALIRATRDAAPVQINVDAGLTVGVNTTVTGSATISDGSSPGAACDSTNASHAIVHSSNTSIKLQGNGNDIFGTIHKDSRNTQQLMHHVLAGMTLEELAARATIKFGPMYGRPAFNNSLGPVHNATNPDYRWGCPAKLMIGCPTDAANFFPVVAIDANGGEVDITGTHAQGTLIIRNGNVKIRGNFLFQGILIVEGKTHILGTPRLEGAVIAMGEETLIDDKKGDGEHTGNSLVRFNKCEIVNAQRGLTQGSIEFTAQQFGQPTFGWFEVVR